MTEEEAVFFMEHAKGRKGWFVIECINSSFIVAKPKASILKELVEAIADAVPEHNLETDVVFLTGPRRLHNYLFGPPKWCVRPKWKVREYDGHNRGRVRPRSAEYLQNFASCTTFPHNLDDHSGWAIDIANRHIWYYGIRIVAMFIFILVVWCAVLWFFSPYTGLWKDILYHDRGLECSGSKQSRDTRARGRVKI